MNFEFTKRVAFAMRKRGIKTNLQRLDECTRRIDTWIERAGKIQDEPTTRRSKLCFIDSVNEIQGNASKVYCALSQSWCKIKPRHPTFLLLEQRLKRPRSKKRRYQESVSGTEAGSTCFKLKINGECSQRLQQFDTEFRVAELPSRCEFLSHCWTHLTYRS
jgi:hypothetical protein